MIDKLDLRIPKEAKLRPAVQDIFSYDPARRLSDRVHPAAHYEGRVDLRQVGIDANFHVKCKHGGRHSKLEVLDVGKKSFSQIVDLVESVAVVRLDGLGIMRIDLTADVRGVTVPWLKSHARFKYKRTDREYGQLQYGTVGHGELETIISGSRPNVIRIYNKVRELQVQFRRMQRNVSPDAESLQFEKEFGVKESEILTRIERQIGGNRIPPEIATFGCLKNLPDFNPFTSLEIIRSGEHSIPSPQECDGLEYYTGLGLHNAARQMGMQDFRKQLNKQTKGNAARTLDRYSRFFPDGPHFPISTEEIVACFRQSILKQLAA